MKTCMHVMSTPTATSIHAVITVTPTVIVSPLSPLQPQGLSATVWLYKLTLYST